MTNDLLALAKRLVELGGPDILTCPHMMLCHPDALPSMRFHAPQCSSAYMRDDALEKLLEWIKDRASVELEHSENGWVVTIISDNAPHDGGSDSGATPTEAALRAAIWMQERKAKDD